MKTKTIFFAFGWLLFSIVLNAQATFSVPAGICPNTPTLLSASTGTLSNCTFTWSGVTNGVVFSSANSPTTTVSLSASGLYTLSLSITSGTVISTFQNTIACFPSPTITLTQNTFTTCITSNSPLLSKPVQLFATGGTSYTWNPPFNPLAGNPNGPSNTVRPISTSCFTVTGQNAYGCTLAAVSCVTVVPRFTISVSPSDTIVCLNPINGPDQLVKLTANNPSPPANGLPSSHTYVWSGFGIVTPTVSATIFVGTFSSGSFTAEIRDSLNCISRPAVATVSIVSCTGLEINSAKNEQVSIYPNPTKGLVFLSSVYSESKIKLYNSVGQEIRRLDKLATEIDLKELSPGIYFFRIESGNERMIYKLVKE